MSLLTHRCTSFSEAPSGLPFTSLAVTGPHAHPRRVTGKGERAWLEMSRGLSWGGARRCPTKSRFSQQVQVAARKMTSVSAMLILQRQKDRAPGVLETARALRGGVWDRGGRICPVCWPEQRFPHRAVASSRCVPQLQDVPSSSFPVRGQPNLAFQGPLSGRGHAHVWRETHVSCFISQCFSRRVGGGPAGLLPTCRAHLGLWSLHLAHAGVSIRQVWPRSSLFGFDFLYEEFV